MIAGDVGESKRVELVHRRLLVVHPRTIEEVGHLVVQLEELSFAADLPPAVELFSIAVESHLVDELYYRFRRAFWQLRRRVLEHIVQRECDGAVPAKLVREQGLLQDRQRAPARVNRVRRQAVVPAQGLAQLERLVAMHGERVVHCDHQRVGGAELPHDARVLLDLRQRRPETTADALREHHRHVFEVRLGAFLQLDLYFLEDQASSGIVSVDPIVGDLHTDHSDGDVVLPVTREHLGDLAGLAGNVYAELLHHLPRPDVRIGGEVAVLYSVLCVHGAALEVAARA